MLITPQQKGVIARPKCLDNKRVSSFSLKKLYLDKILHKKRHPNGCLLNIG
jgi:hypothetical protein